MANGSQSQAWYIWPCGRPTHPKLRDIFELFARQDWHKYGLEGPLCIIIFDWDERQLMALTIGSKTRLIGRLNLWLKAIPPSPLDVSVHSKKERESLREDKKILLSLASIEAKEEGRR